jgi:nucleoid DNA-binding protein
MEKSDLAKQIGERHGVEPGDAADQMDRAVNKLVRALRQGKAARLPGLGTIKPGKPWTFHPEKNDR